MDYYDDEREKMNPREVPIWRKMNLTIQEASAVSGIGQQTIREQATLPGANFAFKVGNKTMINRKLFDKYIEDVLCGNAERR